MSIKYFPFSSIVETPFWYKLTEYKLNDLKLNTDPVPIWGTYNNQVGLFIPPPFTLHHDAFESLSDRLNDIIAPGLLLITNTIEDFKKQSKVEILSNHAAERIWNAIVDGSALENPLILSSFVVFMFADLKKFKYFHWFGFAAFSYPESVEITSSIQLEDVISQEKLKDVYQQYYDKNKAFCSGYFCVLATQDIFKIYSLSNYESLRKQNEDHVWLGFADPCSFRENPGWPLRNLLTLAAVQWPQYRRHTVLSFRYSTKEQSFGKSLVLEIHLKGESTPPSTIPSSFGWERNSDGKLAPKFSDLKSKLDPVEIAESAVNLNLKLMRWRLAPNINLDAIRKCRCLLLGAGTLGCNIARGLLGWGIQTMSFVDFGDISYSNPVRQTLYEFEDCKERKLKAPTAAKAIKRIHPMVNSEGFVFKIPMPGHSVSEKEIIQVQEDAKQIENLIKEHDAIFLLTDSRESRWLPTLLGIIHDKIVITTAIGFDSFVVVRHGSYASRKKRLGCYFCNDVTTPGDSTADRTLDQQCTVTRPGTSFMASGHAVEMLASILQHPLGVNAPAHSDDEFDGVFGPVPHSVRYYISSSRYITCSTPSFNQCPACGIKVVEAFKKDGFDFVLKALNDGSHLEKVSGLTDLYDTCTENDLFGISSSESEE